MSQKLCLLPLGTRRQLVQAAFDVRDAAGRHPDLFGDIPSYVTGIFSEDDPLTALAQLNMGLLTPDDAMLFSGYMVDKGRRCMADGRLSSQQGADPSRGLYGGACAHTVLYGAASNMVVACSTSGMEERQDMAVSLATLWHGCVIDLDMLRSGKWHGYDEAMPYLEGLVSTLRTMRQT